MELLVDGRWQLEKQFAAKVKRSIMREYTVLQSLSADHTVDLISDCSSLLMCDT